MIIPKYKIAAIFIVLFTVGFIALGVLEVRLLDNTIGGWTLLQNAAFGGIITGIAAGIFFQKKFALKEAVQTMRMWLVCLFVPAFLFPIMLSFINHTFTTGNEIISVEFLEEVPVVTGGLLFSSGEKIKPEVHHLFVFYEGKIERFTVNEPCCSSMESGRRMELKLKKGRLGFAFLER